MRAMCDEKPKPGDRIEFLQGIYHHWALYVGDGDVVHLTPYCNSGILSSMVSLTNGKALVQKDKLSDVVGYDGWRVNNDLDKKHVPRRAEDIVTAARHAVGRELDYSVVTKNCEHFVNKLRYARGDGQIRTSFISSGPQNIGGERIKFLTSL
uniref:LRAT domain-containing protein n=1 Tax=Gouania willdenowi TaxID=441366 RepID=A0A8C5DZI5_GOUWI